MKKISVEVISSTYKKKGCNVSATCSALNISRQTFYKWKEKYPKLQSEIDEADESLLDFAESKLLEKIGEGDTTSLIFYLKTKGKKRGYVEKIENEVTINAFEEALKNLPD